MKDLDLPYNDAVYLDVTELLVHSRITTIPEDEATELMAESLRTISYEHERTDRNRKSAVTPPVRQQKTRVPSTKVKGEDS